MLIAYQQYIHLSKYARWLDHAQRRETWHETVTRWLNYFDQHVTTLTGEPGLLSSTGVAEAITNMQVMPSMRALMTAGPALERDHVAGYNCSYLAVDHPHAFDEALYILMCGTGVGYSVERQVIAQLPPVPAQLVPTDYVIDVEDSRIGWASALRELIAALYAGKVPQWSTHRVRPAGSRLHTFGGRASGAEPLISVFKHTVATFKGAAGRKLNSLECHDLMCKIAECVVAGGVRRSAMLSLSNLSDERMRDCKSGEWWHVAPYRAMANNSVAYTEKPEPGRFMREWLALYEAKSGERGIFNRAAVQKQIAGTRRGSEYPFGVNPCSEIILRPQQFCNLSSVVIRAEDTEETLAHKVRLATIIGTVQSTLTDFRYLRPEWQRNCNEERLLGVSLSGIMDHPVLRNTGRDAIMLLEYLRGIARETNRRWSSILGIAPSAAITCVKPEGNSSQLVNSASGIHPRHSEYYIRRVRQNVHDPLTRFMIDSGITHQPDYTNPNTMVFEFAIASPLGAVCRDDRTALQQLEHWLMFREHWCEHNPSITVTVREHEWLEVGAWVYKHFDQMSGVSFLPHSDHTYQQAPYEAISEAEYKKLVAATPVIDWSCLSEYENTQNTTTGNEHEFACTGGACEIR